MPILGHVRLKDIRVMCMRWKQFLCQSMSVQDGKFDWMIITSIFIQDKYITASMLFLLDPEEGAGQNFK